AMQHPEVADGGPPLRGIVHDGNARLLSGIAGHAGLFSTADDLARFSRMLLEGGTLEGHRYLKESAGRGVFPPPAARACDLPRASPRPLGSSFPEAPAGHPGFTGPSMWLDPVSRRYVIIM